MSNGFRFSIYDICFPQKKKYSFESCELKRWHFPTIEREGGEWGGPNLVPRTFPLAFRFLPQPKNKGTGPGNEVARYPAVRALETP